MSTARVALAMTLLAAVCHAGVINIDQFDKKACARAFNVDIDLTFDGDKRVECGGRRKLCDTLYQPEVALKNIDAVRI